MTYSDHQAQAARQKKQSAKKTAAPHDATQPPGPVAGETAKKKYKKK